MNLPITMTTDQWHDFQRTGVLPRDNAKSPGKAIASTPASRVHNGRTETGIEARMRMELAGELVEGKILWFLAQAVKLRIAGGTFYTPDFAIGRLDGRVEFRETKGSWKMPHQDDSRVKIKVAAEMFPQFVFSAFVPRQSGWMTEFWNLESKET